MSEHEPCIGATSEWYTPPAIFQALGLVFDLDPCSPGPDHWVPAAKVFTEADDGLAQDWEKGSIIFLNPPFGGRNGQVPWIKKFIAHGNGVGIVAARTSSGWWHDLMPQVDGILFPKGKTKFVAPNGEIGKSPGTGIALIAMGMVSCDALRHSGLGMYWDLWAQRERLPAWQAVARTPMKVAYFSGGAPGLEGCQ
jgi:hypothetical protein